MSEIPEASKIDVEAGRNEAQQIAIKEMTILQNHEHAVMSLNPREDMPIWKWILLLVGLYLGALLYGTYF